MSWAIGWDGEWKRDIGYSVPAVCDHPDCDTEIDRGLSYVCGGEPYGGEVGCGLYFCEQHLTFAFLEDEDETMSPQLCEVCAAEFGKDDYEGKMFEPKPDTKEWMRWKLNHGSWAEWRDNHPDEVKNMQKQVSGGV
jgi:hypothetical protein